ncbi:hypothetical protein LB169_002344 [Acinetobacter baumannii]|nr:hypothetical protein [Acinetobacter baumannii]EKX9959467.1 hypothetical protein [Acinetobacter baumannii]EKY0928484.1 hypothetical protein [Acinetobacter baumannii]EKY1173530.1 hypothetical protein [Acinetobacter baumannii]HCW3947907.1 hypothetical protein [Acinetobacter baumannii]
MKPSVLCISLGALDVQNVPSTGHGVHPFDLNAVPGDQFHFINRAVVDHTDVSSFEFKVGNFMPQILGYIVVKHQGQILTYARKHSAGESRLLGSRSIGFGGHVDLEDYLFAGYDEAAGVCYEPDFPTVLQYSIKRELQEELLLDIIDDSQIKFEGIIVDTHDSVGMVHRGLLCVIELDNPSDVTSTKETQDLVWQSIEGLKKDIDLYEGWSQIAINSGLI